VGKTSSFSEFVPDYVFNYGSKPGAKGGFSRIKGRAFVFEEVEMSFIPDILRFCVIESLGTYERDAVVLTVFP